jgi:hypothetical protein
VRKPFTYTTLLVVLFASCKLAADAVTGIYQPADHPCSRLVLKNDNTFEYLGKSASAEDRDDSGRQHNFLTTGTWQLKNDQLLLNSFSKDSVGYDAHLSDSITRFTTISSFNFWNQFGDPVSIRSIILPRAKTKPHYGNCLYLFAQDFKPNDTLVFHLDGYPDFRYPGTIPYAMGNNMHKITLREPYRPAAFINTSFTLKRNSLTTQNSSLVLTRKK